MMDVELDPIAWPNGSAEMAGCVRSHHWAATPLGPAEDWPASLRTVVDLLLPAGFPVLALWGPDLVQIYNDRYRDLMESTHPVGFGQPIRECWPELWRANKPLYDRVWSGETVVSQDTIHPATHTGLRRDARFTLSHSPLRDEAGMVAGILVVLFETAAGHPTTGRRATADTPALESARQHRPPASPPDAVANLDAASIGKERRAWRWNGISADADARMRAEAALHQGERRFRALATAGSVLLYRMSPDWQLLYRLDGQGFLAGSGTPMENWAERYLLPRDRPEVFKAIAQAVRTRSVLELEHRVRYVDGHIGWVASRAVPIFDEDGGIIEWVGVGHDVTEHRETRERLRAHEANHRDDLERQVRERTAELKASRDLLQASMNSSPDMIQVFEAVRDEQGGIVDFRWVLNNHASERAYGDVIGHSLLRTNPGVVPVGIFDSFRRVVDSGRTHRAEWHYVHEQFNGWFYQSAAKLGDGVATMTSDITELKRTEAELLRLRDEVAQAKLRESEERLQAIFASASVGLSEVGLDGRFLRVNNALCRFLGRTQEQLLTLGVADVTHADDVSPSLKVIAHTLETGRTGSLDKRYCRPDGTLVWANSTVTRLHEGADRPGNLLVVTVNLTARRTAEAAIAESEGRLRTLMQGIPQLVWRAGAGGRWTWSSPQWQTFTGQSQQQSLGLGWLEAVHPDDRAAAMDAWDKVQETGGLDIEFRVQRASDGAYLWHRTRSLPVNDSNGQITEWLGTCTDMQQVKELQERQAVLVAELQHRTRNLIAVVRSIARQTMERTGPTPAFAEQFSDRLEALARVQGLLSRSDEAPITLDAIVGQELAALGGTDRVRVDGPSVRLRHSTVQTLSLALHELATNARKYGALAGDLGRLEVSWTVRTADDGEHRLVLSWIEDRPDIAVAAAEVPRHGYGRDLIEKALPYALGASTTYKIGPRGVCCIIDMPLERRPRRRRNG